MKALPIVSAVSAGLFGATAFAGISQNCGGAIETPCPRGQVCDLSVKDTNVDLIGICTPKPIYCAAVYIPVCGANGFTYSNECAAHSVGISVSAHGACPVPMPEVGDAGASY